MFGPQRSPTSDDATHVDRIATPTLDLPTPCPPADETNCSQQPILVAVDLLADTANVSRTIWESSGGPDDAVTQPDHRLPI